MSIRGGGAASLAVCLLLSVAACGGGGGGASFPIIPVAGSTPDTPPPATDPEPKEPEAPQPKLEYQLFSSASTDNAKYLEFLNAEGAKGFRLAGLMLFDKQFQQLLVKPTEPAVAYAYSSIGLSPNQDEKEWLRLANEKGAQGFRVVPGSIFQKSGSDSTKYSYTFRDSLRFSQTTQMGEFDFLNLINEQGALGSRYVGESYVIVEPNVPKFRSLFEKVEGARYGYEALQRPESNAELLKQFNAEGARGYRFAFVAISLGPMKSIVQWIYVKDLNQSSRFSYRAVEKEPETPSAFIAQLNEQAASGAAIFIATQPNISEPGSLSTAFHSIYSTSTDCKGILCGELRQFGVIDQPY